MLSVVTSCLARAWDAATFLAALVIHVSFKSLFKTIGALISYMCQVACQVWHVVDVVSLGSSSYATEALWTSSETLLAMIGSRGRFIKVILFMSLQVWTHAGDWAVCRHRLIVMASLLGICCGMSIYPIWVVLNCIVAVLARTDLSKKLGCRVVTLISSVCGDNRRGHHDGGLQDARTCCICMDAVRRPVVLIPCGHGAFCEECIRALGALRSCPICRQHVNSSCRVHLQ
eukprot:TRINITY_DN9284_c0_g1_i2.p2 TRINITY_DN9284_c0_g1~~TRINITY_DN9284_c0_g1_i2.p2  ORF type:complete len:230 (+),score=23.59 TRINITY_DN9284_c0_g1_i2:905-1594(+)